MMRARKAIFSPDIWSNILGMARWHSLFPTGAWRLKREERAQQTSARV